MRLALPLACLLVTTSAAADPPSPGSEIERSQPNVLPWPDVGTAIVPDMTLNFMREPADCGERLQIARDDRGLPRLQRDTADPEKPLLIKALDQRVNGCSVMVMHHDVNDIRALPRPHEPRMMRAR